MAKLAALAKMSSLANSTSFLSALNANWDKITTALNNTISRDGSLPNAMLADFDVNGNRLLNVGEPVDDTDGVNYGNLKALVNNYAGEIVADATFAQWTVDQFTASAGQVAFPLSSSPVAIATLDVSVNGLTKLSGQEYTLAAGVVTFTTPMSGGEKVQIRYGNALPVGYSDTGLSVFQQQGTGAVQRVGQDKLREWVTPEDFGAKGDGVTDDCAAFDNALLALKALGGGVLRLARGKTYMLSSVRYGTGTALTIPSNITIVAYGATIKRGSAAVTLMLRNDSDGSVGGYDANSDITILGGTWDPNYPGIAGASMPMGFTHTKRIRIRDAHMFSGFGAHHIEINACSDVVIEGCKFEGGAEQLDTTMEAVQIDGAISSATWGTGPYDQTFCSNVKVIGNSFVNCGSGVGTHSSVTGKRHNLITVANNTFSSCYFIGVRALNWENSAIIGNHFFGGAEGVRVYADAATINKGIAVNNNTFWQIGLSGASGAGNGHAIYFYGNSGGTEQINYYSICNNVIRDCAFANSGCGIKVLYCPFGTINGNTIDNVLSTGISIFGNGGMTISGNYVQDCGASSISAGSAGSVNITDNIVNTIDYTSITRSLVTGNIVSNASGITASGTNTNTTAIHNLVSTTFA